MFTDYLQQIGLKYLIPDITKTKLNNFVKEAFAKTKNNFTKEEIEKLCTYKVPKLSADGSCSIIDDLNPVPYDLRKIYGITSYSHPERSERSHSINKLPKERDSSHALSAAQNDTNYSMTTILYLWRLKQIVNNLQKITGADWLGIYKKIKNEKGELILVKESYYGIPSRAEFPLTTEFAKKSNNPTVGLTGKAIVIGDIYAHSGAYYKCDGKVQSEFCVPITNVIPSERQRVEESTDPSTPGVPYGTPFAQDDNSEILGIIDAEAFPKHFFTNEKILQITKTAYDLSFI